LGLCAGNIFAQGDGSHSYLLSPKGITGVNAKWLSLDQNFIPAGTAMVPGAEIRVDVFPITIFHTFSLGGKIAQAYCMFNPGSAVARAKIGPPIGPIPVYELSASGFSDGFIAFKIGLLGAPAIAARNFAQTPMQFSLFADLRYWYSGTYDANKLFNLGTNRNIVQIGFPMAIPLNRNRKTATWLEIAPALDIFTDNNDPARASSAKKLEQAPLFLLENHLSHNFNPKLWGTVNMRFQQGGQTAADGVKDGNSISAVGGGLGLGYQLLPPLSLSMDYGGALFGQQAKGSMFRISMVFAYANLKKN
jgi:hypothetical protein